MTRKKINHGFQLQLVGVSWKERMVCQLQNAHVQACSVNNETMGGGEVGIDIYRRT